MRLIDADALSPDRDYYEVGGYDAVSCEQIDKAPTVDTTCPNCDSGYAQGYSDGYLKGKEERPQGEWIPVSERLPHAEYGESDTVLVSACWISDKDLKDKAIFVTEAYFDGSCFRTPTGEVYWNIKVIAWQPLPKPYKEVANEY